jgi:hypothetical protein
MTTPEVLLEELPPGAFAIKRINSIINPDKLGHLGRVADLTALLSDARDRARRSRL